MCGIGGAWGEGAGRYVSRMARWLMHRGEEGVGFAYLTKDGIRVGEPHSDVIAAIVHTRYSTTGPYDVQVQPVLARYRDFEAAVAFNGTITNYKSLYPHAETDAEALARKFVELLWEYGLIEGLRALYGIIEGAASIIALTNSEIIGVRDLRGIRPLSYGINALASESIALDGPSMEVPPGYVVIHGNGTKVMNYGNGEERLCALEYVYFAHPASRIGGRLVGDVRRLLGRRLAEGEDREIDVVTYVPETARDAAIAYAETLGKPLVGAIVKNRYVGRIFIKPPGRREEVTESFKVIGDLVKGMRVAVVDDSLIRGTNMKAIVKALREAGATEVHLRIASPPIRWPCYYGMDFQDPGELIARDRSVEEVARVLGVDSLRYLPLEDFREVLGPSICYACFTGEYPVRVSPIMRGRGLRGDAHISI